ncbi:MAG: tRNA (N6-isopentenyl adenosine(37)-C2)-methylthiotransferase MiaB [Spirochaetaceae bacterium]|nr:MAG: tRNA (N6-isopentenyl adenosine(37)-C2)-methylthiotransferase MiaB [Spirochaetaceae bacterium]
MTGRRYWLETYGCQMNKAESEALENDLINAGWLAAKDSQSSDLVILNTCSVRKTAEDRIWGRIGNLKKDKRNRHFLLAIMGCMSQRLGEEMIKQVPDIDIVVGTFNKDRFLDIVEQALAKRRGIVASDIKPYIFANGHTTGGFRAFVPIMHGCDNYCSYCIVPYVRGHEISRNPEEIMAEVMHGMEHGVREITLLGQNVNSYRFPVNGREVLFEEILTLVAQAVKGHGWVRFMTSHPRDMSLTLVDTIASHQSICRHIHLPVQHGSDQILQAMNRHYTINQYTKLVSYIKNTISDVTLTTDILIGFPGETEEDFNATCRLLEEIEFDDAYMYYYNPRQGTAAFNMMETLSETEKKKRLARIIELQHGIRKKRLAAKTGKISIALVEEVSRRNKKELLARTEHNDMILIEGQESMLGTFVEVRLESLRGTTFKGVL